MRRTFTAGLLTLALALAGCFSTGENYVTGNPIEVDDFDELWMRAEDVLAQKGFRVDDALSRRSEKILVTAWEEDLMPFRYKGKRRRTHVRFVEMEGGRYAVDVWVEQERNTEFVEPMNPIAADWEADPQAESGRAEEIQYKIEYIFLPTELEHSR